MKKSQVGQSAICPKCNIGLTLVHSEGLQVCNQCGVTEYILIDSEKPSFREPPPEVSYFAYKRINHFNEWLSQFQAKESTEIPTEIYQLILLEMKKERITDLNKITHTKIREYLKKLKLNKYYEHIPHILNKLNKKVPLISKEVEEKLRHMFKEIQAPFMKICPPNRKNFLSYSYVLHKFVELLGLDHLKEGFPLLKSREKLHQQDQMWKEICKELNWMFIKSI
jgi:ribosomal protein S27AE